MKSSTPKNRIVREVNEGSLFESARNVITSSTSWNQGDLLFYDGSTDTIKPVTAEADGATFVGIANQTIVNGVPKQPYTTATAAAEAVQSVKGPSYGVIALLKLNEGDSFVSGDPVYVGPTDSDPQTVQASGTRAIGIFVGADITAAASDQGEVLLGHRYPGDTLVIP